MNNFKKLLQENLDSIPQGLVATVLSTAATLKEAESVARNARQELNDAIETLNSQLALEIRKRMPKLQVNLASGKCNVRFKSKAVTVWPDVMSKKWQIDPNDMGRSFVRGFSHALPMQDDLSSIAEAIVEYFTGHYKSLGDTFGVKNTMPTEVKQKGKSKPGNSYYV